jgi:uncharacterized membrane protein
VDDRNLNVTKTLTKNLLGHRFAARVYIPKPLFELLCNDGVLLVTGITSNLKNKLIHFHDRIILQKCPFIETINDRLKKLFTA